jgi:hypothetical protein
MSRRKPTPEETERLAEYRRKRNIRDRCSDCEKWYYVYRNSHYIYGLCPECLEATPMMPYEGDHFSGKKDYRALLRRDGQEGDDYFG